MTISVPDEGTCNHHSIHKSTFPSGVVPGFAKEQFNFVGGPRRDVAAEDVLVFGSVGQSSGRKLAPGAQAPSLTSPQRVGHEAGGESRVEELTKSGYSQY
jgi:hypothetical protein